MSDCSTCWALLGGRSVPRHEASAPSHRLSALKQLPVRVDALYMALLTLMHTSEDGCDAR